MRALEWINLASALAAVVGTWFLGREWGGRTNSGSATAHFSALLLLISPVFWVYSAGTESYTIDAALGAWTAWLLWRAVRSARTAPAADGTPEPRPRPASSPWIYLGVLGLLWASWLGLRSSGAVLVVPALLIALIWIARRRGILHVAVFFLGAGLGLLAWVPFWLRYFPSPSLQTVRRLNAEQLYPFLHDHSMFWGAPWKAAAIQGVRANLWLAACLGEAGLAVVGFLLIRAFLRRRPLPARLPSRNALSWSAGELTAAVVFLAPIYLFHALIYIQKPAYWFAALPVVFSLLAAGVCRLKTPAPLPEGSRRNPLLLSGYQRPSPFIRIVFASAVLLGAARFLLPAALQPSPPGFPSPTPPSALSRLVTKYSAGEMLRRHQEMLAFAHWALQNATEDAARHLNAVFLFAPGGNQRFRRLEWLCPALTTLLVHEYHPRPDIDRLTLVRARDHGESWIVVEKESESPWVFPPTVDALLPPGDCAIYVWCDESSRVCLDGRIGSQPTPQSPGSALLVILPAHRLTDILPCLLDPSDSHNAPTNPRASDSSAFATRTLKTSL